MLSHEQLKVQIRTTGAVGFAYLTGRLVAETRHELAGTLREWDLLGERTVIISLRDLGYMDSAGLSSLIKVWKDNREAGGTVLVSELTPTLRTLFDVSSVKKIFHVFPTMEDAVASLQLTEGLAVVPSPPVSEEDDETLGLEGVALDPGFPSESNSAEDDETLGLGAKLDSQPDGPGRPAGRNERADVQDLETQGDF